MIKSLKLQNFRNFSGTSEYTFPPSGLLIVGPNGSGKTNILESISLLSNGRSFRARVEEEMIMMDMEIARVFGVVESGGEENQLEMVLTRGQIERGGIIKPAPRKRTLVNGVGRRVIDFVGKFSTVLFRPQDMELVTDSPSVRRKFLDGVLSGVDYEYRRALLSYEKGLRRRNKLLLAIREEGASRTELYFWDRLLIKNGEYIAAARASFLDFVNNFSFVGGQRYSVFYDRSVISEKRLMQYAKEEVYAGMTLVGPHRDDFEFRFESKLGGKEDLAVYGSRGEQRMGVLWIKMAEMAFMEEKSGERPTLLLDDIFSELDHEHRTLVGGLINQQQTILTTADPHYVTDISGFSKIELGGKL